MPRKKDPDRTPSMKVVQLAFYLLFNGRKYSLTELAQKMGCSKPTILRIIAQLEGIPGLVINSEQSGPRNQSWYWAEAPQGAPRVTLDVEDIQHLQLCRDIVYHLLPRGLREEISTAIRHTTRLLPDFSQRGEALQTVLHAYAKGVIDYTQSQAVLVQLLKGLRRHLLCIISYCSKTGSPAKQYTIAPLRLIAYHEGLYLRGRLEEGLTNGGKHYDRLFSIHRIGQVELTNRKYHIESSGPEPLTFGLMAGKPFRARVQFQPAAAQYVSERKWSDDQKIAPAAGGGIVLEFTATSEPEVLSWVLSFGSEATLLEPASLRAELRNRLARMADSYQG